jgi:hypothetical protein
MGFRKTTWKLEHDGSSSFGFDGARSDTLDALENWAARAPGRRIEGIEADEVSGFVVTVAASTDDREADDELDLSCGLIGMVLSPVARERWRW